MTQARTVFAASGVSLLSYCLMPNHYHLLVALTDTVLSRSMHALQTRYSMYFNRVNSRVGHLFQDRFKSFDVACLDYLAWLPVYIHMNPVRAGLATRPEGWRWSGHAELISKRMRYLDLTSLLEFGFDSEAFRIQYRSSLERVNQPLPKKASLRQVVEWCSFACGVRWQDVIGGARGGPFTRAKVRLMSEARNRGYTMTDVAAVLRCSHASLSQLVSGAPLEKGQAS